MIEIKTGPNDEKETYVEWAGSILDIELPVEIWIDDDIETPSLSFLWKSRG